MHFINDLAANGIVHLSKQKSAMILAWVLHYGGSHEAVVKNLNISARIARAQQVANIGAGQKVDEEVSAWLQYYNQQIQLSYQNGKGEYLDWVFSIFEEFGIFAKQGENHSPLTVKIPPEKILPYPLDNPKFKHIFQ